MYQRICNLSKSHSFFLFGARATGKSTLLQEFSKNFKVEEVLLFDLLDAETERSLNLNPSRLKEIIDSHKGKISLVIIDEVQKIPSLLDIVHKIIFEKKISFALTGSSARKIKRGKANLLAGRAFNFRLHPLTFLELKDDFKMEDIFKFGSLPEIFKFNNDLDKKRYLNAYIQNYIKEEILVEQLIRKIEPFRRFLEVAAQSNTEIINHSKLAREAGIEGKSVERYFEILSDTLLGFYLEPFSRSVRKRQSQKPKFYFFDIGVVRALANQLDYNLVPKTYGYGKFFEQFLILEIIRFNDYYEKGFKFSYLRTKEGAEIDLILEKGKKLILIEIKSSNNILEDDLKTLKHLGKELEGKKYVFCLEKRSRVSGNIKIMNWKDGLLEIFE